MQIYFIDNMNTSSNEIPEDYYVKWSTIPLLPRPQRQLNRAKILEARFSIDIKTMATLRERRSEKTVTNN